MCGFFFLFCFKKKSGKNMMNKAFQQVNGRARELKRKTKEQHTMMIKTEENNFQSEKPT